MQTEFQVDEEQGVPGWISMTDGLMLGTIMLVGLAISSGGDRDTARRAAAIAETEVGRLTVLVNEKSQRINVLEDDKRKLEEVVVGLRAEIDQLKRDIEILRLQIPDESAVVTITRLKQQVTDLEKTKTELESMNTQLTTQLDAEKTLAAMLTKQVASLTDQLATVMKELNAGKIELAAKTKELDATMKLLALAQAEIELLKKRLADPEKRETQLQLKLADALKLVEQLRLELKQARESELELLAKNKQLENELADANSRIEKLELENALLGNNNEKLKGTLDAQKERILKPLETAGLVIRIRARNLNSNYDLDLYVQDPNDRLCSWKNPRILTKTSQQATLIPSESLRMAHESDGTKPSRSLTEEAFYASDVTPGKPYLLFCMIRKIGEFTESEDIEQLVEWEITTKRPNAARHVLNGQTVVTKTGAIKVTPIGETYPGLMPLMGFEIANPDPLELRRIVESKMPKLPRGWGLKGYNLQDPEFIKLNDQDAK